MRHPWGMGENIPRPTPMGKVKTPENATPGPADPEAARVAPAKRVGAGVRGSHRLYRTRARTPATAARNRTAYSTGLGPAVWRMAASGPATRPSWIEVILTL